MYAGLRIYPVALRALDPELAVVLQFLRLTTAVGAREKVGLFHFITSGLRCTTLLEPS